MKLLRFKLNVDFRGLPKGFEIRFPRDPEDDFAFHPYCLAGRNGGGKSNVLEALAAIFYHIECIYLELRPQDFAFDPKVARPDAFELEYFIPRAGAAAPRGEKPIIDCVAITKGIGERPLVQRLVTDEAGVVTRQPLSRSEVKESLPEYVLAYSSGHNEILSLPFLKMRFIHFDEYRERLVKQLDYPGRPEGRLTYLDDQFNQAILLCHFLFPSPAVTQVFEDKIKLTGVRRFRLVLRRDHALEVTSEAPSVPTPAIEPEQRQTVELTSLLDDLVEKLVKCSTAHSVDPDGDGQVILDYWVDDATRSAFRAHFGVTTAGGEDESQAASALNLFHALQTLLTLNYYQVGDATKAELYRSESLYMNETIPMPASDQRILRFKDFELIKQGAQTDLYAKALSDGEHQLVHTIGLCLLYRHSAALFLLDEPETHLNPDWRASYVSTLRQALSVATGDAHVMREILLTSHSPFVISDCRPQNVLIFDRNDQGRVFWKQPDFNTFGASANAITIRIFGRRETIGDYARSQMDELRDRLEGGEAPEALIQQAFEQFGDSVERTLFVSQALERQETL